MQSNFKLPDSPAHFFIRKSLQAFWCLQQPPPPPERGNCRPLQDWVLIFQQIFLRILNAQNYVLVLPGSHFQGAGGSVFPEFESGFTVLISSGSFRLLRKPVPKLRGWKFLELEAPKGTSSFQTDPSEVGSSSIPASNL